MVGGRRQRMSSAAGGKRLEPTMSAPDTKSPLVSLPTEIQGIITSYLAQSRDLNHLCCTCKALSAVVLPTLYHTIELKIPLRWGRLPSLENLLASSSEGLKYTRCLRIVTKQYPQKDNKYLNLEKVPDADDDDVVDIEHESGDEGEAESGIAELEEIGYEDEGLFRIYQPSTSASKSLNAFIRVLLYKLPPQQLHIFWWEHACSLSPRTIMTLLKQHGGSINTLKFREYNRNWESADLANLKMKTLTTLGMAELGIVDSLATELLAKNLETLRHLRLGSELELAEQYAKGGYMHFDEEERFDLAHAFREILQTKVAAINEPSTVVVQLESLSLIGLHLRTFVDGLFAPEFDFNSLRMLTLESCCGLEEAFPLLLGPKDGTRKAKSALGLHTLAIRHESTGLAFSRAFEKFLLSLKPLTHLHVLLESPSDYNIKLRKILQIHGKSLRSFLWDEKIGPRRDMAEDNHVCSPDHENLATVARYCPGLKALGISLDWRDITGSGKHHKKISSSFSRLSQLQTLNIRNLPVAMTSKTWLPNDYMMEGLLTMLLNVITKNAQIVQALTLKTVAIGAPTYGSVRVGMNHYTPSSTSDFYQLRIYHVNYGCQYRDTLSPKLHLIARGTPADAWGNAENLDIFALYWLDGVPVDPARYYS